MFRKSCLATASFLLAAVACACGSEALAALPRRTAAAATGPWIDCLALMKPERHTIRGKWEVRDNALVNDDAGYSFAQIIIPLIPAGGYEMDIVFVRTTKDGVIFISLPMGKTSTSLALGWGRGEASGLDQVNRKNPRDNEASVKPGKLENNREYAVGIKVLPQGDDVEISVTLGGGPFLTWKGPASALNPGNPWMGRFKSPLVYLTTGTMELRRVRMRTLGGEMKPAPDLPPPPPPKVAVAKPPAPPATVTPGSITLAPPSPVTPGSETRAPSTPVPPPPASPATAAPAAPGAIIIPPPSLAAPSPAPGAAAPKGTYFFGVRAKSADGIKPSAVAPDGWIDCLQLVEPGEHSVKGAWESSGGGLSLTAKTREGRITVPLLVTGSYELEAAFTRNTGSDCVAVCLPVGSAACVLMLGGGGGAASGLECIKGKGFRDNETTVRPAAFINECPYKVIARIVVRENEAEIQIRLDKRAYINWTGPLSALSAADQWKLTDPRCPGLGANDSTVTFTSVRLRPVTDAAATPAK